MQISFTISAASVKIKQYQREASSVTVTGSPGDLRDIMGNLTSLIERSSFLNSVKKFTSLHAENV